MAQWGQNQGVFDTLGSIYGAGSSPSYYSSDLQGPAATIGGALTTNPTPGVMSAQGAPVNATVVVPQLQGTVLGQPVTHIFALALVAIVIYYLIHRTIPGVESKLATPRIGIGSFFSIGVQAVLFIVLFKTILTKYTVPGLSQVVAAA